MCDAFSVSCGIEEPCENLERSGYCDRVKNKDLCRRLDIKKLPCVQFFRGAEGHVATVMCGPSKFPDVRLKLEDLLGHSHHPDDVPEFTDVSEHYNGTDVSEAYA